MKGYIDSSCYISEVKEKRVYAKDATKLVLIVCNNSSVVLQKREIADRAIRLIRESIYKRKLLRANQAECQTKL